MLWGALIGLILRLLPGAPPLLSLGLGLIGGPECAATAYLVHLVGRRAGSHFIESDQWPGITYAMAALLGGLLGLVAGFGAANGAFIWIPLVVMGFMYGWSFEMFLWFGAGALFMKLCRLPFAPLLMGSLMFGAEPKDNNNQEETDAVFQLALSGATGLIFAGVSPAWVGKPKGLDLIEVAIESYALISQSGKGIVMSYLEGVQNPGTILAIVIVSCLIPKTGKDDDGVQIIAWMVSLFVVLFLGGWKAIPLLPFAFIGFLSNSKGKRTAFLAPSVFGS